VVKTNRTFWPWPRVRQNPHSSSFAAHHCRDILYSTVLYSTVLYCAGEKTDQLKNKIIMPPPFECLILTLLLLATSIEQAASIEDYYSHVHPANTSECLHLIENLPLKTFEFKYDQVIGRRQLGFIPDDIEPLVPDSVSTAARMNYPNPVKGEKPISVDNIKIVDKSSLFMLNLGATKVCCLSANFYKRACCVQGLPRL
jgi:hypothetical protein